MVLGEEPFVQARCSGCLLSVHLSYILVEGSDRCRQFSYNSTVKQFTLVAQV